MAVTKKDEVAQVTKDSRTNDAVVGDFLSSTGVTLTALGLLGLAMVFTPWLWNIAAPVVAIWWAVVAADKGRRTLPYFLPIGASGVDYHNPVPGKLTRYQEPKGIIFLGNAHEKYLEVWETADVAKRHRVVFGTTGAGKSELLTGLLANFLVLGAGGIFSDAKGTAEMDSKLWWLSRRMGREVDYFLVNYTTGGTTIRKGRRDRVSNRVNPVGNASADDITNMFLSYLPKSSGENQTFQDRAANMFSAMIPARAYLRDIHGDPLTIPVIRDTIGSLTSLLDLARDPRRRLSAEVRNRLINYLNTLPNFKFSEYEEALAKGSKYEINAEAYRMFAYAQNYFSKPLSSLSDTFGYIYSHPSAELGYIDAVKNRRIVQIQLPALEKAPSEIRSIAKLNIANIRGAAARMSDAKAEGTREDNHDNKPTTSEVPTVFIFDEYGYQQTEGFAILKAQCRSLNISLTVAGQDLSNLRMDNNNDEAEAILGNATLYVTPIKNVKDLLDKIQAFLGEADIAVESGLDRTGSVVGGLRRQTNVSIQRRQRLTGSDITSLRTGEGYIIAGGEVGYFKYLPFAPLPKVAPEKTVNRFLGPPTFSTSPEATESAADTMHDWVVRRIEGRDRTPAKQSDLIKAVANQLAKIDTESTGSARAAQWKAVITSGAFPEALATRTRDTSTQTPALPAQASAPLYRRPAITQFPAAEPAPPAPAPSPLPAPAGRPDQAPPPAPPRAPSVEATMGSALPPTRERATPPTSFPSPPVVPSQGFFGQPVDATPDIGEETAPDDCWEDPSVGQAAARLRRLQSSPDAPLPLKSDVDNETALDATGDLSDPSSAERIQDATTQVGLALTALGRSEVGSPKMTPLDRARAEDLVNTIRKSEVYRPPASAPTRPQAPENVRKWMEKVSTKNTRKGKDPGQGE